MGIYLFYFGFTSPDDDHDLLPFSILLLVVPVFRRSSIASGYCVVVGPDEA